MFSKTKRVILYMVMAVVFFAAGWACNKYGNAAGISEDTVVAMVGDHKITFGDWMRQMDILRVIFGSPIDPDNKDQAKGVLDLLIDQEIVLQAAQKDHFSSGAFDESVKDQLQEADLKIKDLRDKLDKDLQTLHRIEKNYQDPFKKMLLANQYANTKKKDVTVTNKDMQDWYDDYSIQAKAAGQNLPPFSKLNDRVKNEKLKPQVQAEKFLKGLQADTKVDKKQEVIDKYLSYLSMSEKMLGSDDLVPPSTDSTSTKKDAGGK